jgi:putative FmdB family regulatory protein
MPLYEYQCAKCGKVFEVRQKFSDEPLTVHEDCGGDVTKLLSAPAFQFKGSGWYITDYAKSGSSGGSKDESSKPSETQTESKPAETKPSESTSAPTTTKSE